MRRTHICLYLASSVIQLVLDLRHGLNILTLQLVELLDRITEHGIQLNKEIRSFTPCVTCTSHDQIVCFTLNVNF
jgi:hypothetical protein